MLNFYMYKLVNYLALETQTDWKTNKTAPRPQLFL